MPFEIDFLAVGSGERSGDAVAIRYEADGAYRVIVYDGGTKESGQRLVEHILRYYGTDYVDHVVNSHPDNDHASGLSVVLEELRVGTLWMHRPWNYSHIILDYFKDGRISSESLKQRLQDKMRAAYELETIAASRQIPVKEPFQGENIGLFHVLSPAQDWYVHSLIPAFEKSPEQKAAESAARHLATYPLLKSITEAAKRGLTWVAEHWSGELLRDDVETSAENESSVILYGYMQQEGEGIILTGDAGTQALTAAADYLERNNVSAPEHVKFIQVPHHGSRHNVSPSTLNRFLGPKLLAPPLSASKIAYVSASAESTTHPRKMVTNAFMRRGAQVIATRGQDKCYSRGTPGRPGWRPVTPLAFFDKVEGWE